MIQNNTYLIIKFSKLYFELTLKIIEKKYIGRVDIYLFLLLYCRIGIYFIRYFLTRKIITNQLRPFWDIQVTL